MRRLAAARSSSPDPVPGYHRIGSGALLVPEIVPEKFEPARGPSPHSDRASATARARAGDAVGGAQSLSQFHLLHLRHLPGGVSRQISGAEDKNFGERIFGR